MRRGGKCWAKRTATTVPSAYAALAMPEDRLIACRLMCKWWAMIGVIGCIAADSPRYGTRAKTTIAAVGP